VTADIILFPRRPAPPDLILITARAIAAIHDGDLLEALGQVRELSRIARDESAPVMLRLQATTAVQGVAALSIAVETRRVAGPDAAAAPMGAPACR
jgi:hypothetical protein